MKKLITNPLLAIIFVFLFAAIIFNSCKKDNSLIAADEKTLLKLKSKTLLSKNSVDLSSRLDVIKSEFLKRKLDAKFAPKNENDFIWTPQWSDPKMQTVNDSVSYVFYHLKPQAKWDGKMIDVKEIGAVRYIMIKNETEFYEAFFYLPSNLRSKTPNNDTPETFMGKFTGKLLLTNLENKQSFLLDYKDGRVSDTYKRQLLASRKQLAVGGATAYYEVVCTTVTLGCSYEATGLGDGCWEEGWRVTYIPDCSYPTACGDWKLTDRRTTTTCETVWFDDPPIDPNDPDDPNGGGVDPNNPSQGPTVLDSLNKIMKPNTCLTAPQMQDLIGTFGDYISGEGIPTWACLHRTIFKRVEVYGKKIGFCIHVDGKGGAYNSGTGDMTWADPSYITNRVTFGHEFFHGFQDAYYPGGTAQYATGSKVGYINIEFEQALFKDIRDGSAYASAMSSAVPTDKQIEYIEWLQEITDNDTTYPQVFSDFGTDANNNNKYFYFLNLFNQYSGYAPHGLIHSTLQPQALLNIFSTSNCK